jgi:hypothetical protein
LGQNLSPNKALHTGASIMGTLKPGWNFQSDAVWRSSPTEIGKRRLSKRDAFTPAPMKLLEVSDWVFQLTIGWMGVVNQNRHRWYTMWPEHRASAPICTGRIYHNYRVHTMIDQVHGWVPVIRRKRGEFGKPPATNHKFAMVVPLGGAAVFEFRESVLFKRPRKPKVQVRH